MTNDLAMYGSLVQENMRLVAELEEAKAEALSLRLALNLADAKIARVSGGKALPVDEKQGVVLMRRQMRAEAA